MKAYLVWKDGRREEYPWDGAERVHYTVASGDPPRYTYTETIFHADAEVVDGCVFYREGETRDVTAEVHRAEERIDQMRADVLKRGLELS